jgi:DNA-binding PadR family transcriptional regulator
LGLLAIRPWTTYELAKALGPTRGVGRWWPRAPSHLYAEPKRLVTLGLAQASTEPTGRRRRTVYTITTAGREALRGWLAAPGPPGPAIVMESEQLLKVFYADSGSRDDLLATLAHVQRWARGDLVEHATVARSYLLGEGPFPDRAAILALGGKLLFDLAVTVEQWTMWAVDVVHTWPSEPSKAEPDWTALETAAHYLPPRDQADADATAQSARP